MAEIDCQETCLMKFLFLGTCEPLLWKKEEERQKPNLQEEEQA